MLPNGKTPPQMPVEFGGFGLVQAFAGYDRDSNSEALLDVCRPANAVPMLRGRGTTMLLHIQPGWPTFAS